MALTNAAIETAYQTVLGRSATEAELQTHAAFETSADLRAALYIDPEYTGSTLPVARLYQTLLGRDPEAAGVHYYVNQLRDGSVTQEGIAAAMMASVENQGSWAGLGDRAYVQQMYQAALGREGEEQGVDYYVARLESGVLTRAGLAVAFANSAEAVTRAGICEFPCIEPGDDALVIGVDTMSVRHAFATGINKVDLSIAGSSDNYLELSNAAVADLEGALNTANAMFNADVRYVFVAGAKDGYLLGDANGDLQADTAVTLVGVTSLDGFAAADIV